MSTYVWADMTLGGPMSRKLTQAIVKRRSNRAISDPFENYLVMSKKTGKVVNMDRPVEAIASKRNAKNRQRLTSYISSVAKKSGVDLSNMTMDDLKKLDLY